MLTNLNLQLENFENDKQRLLKSLSILGVEYREYLKHPCETVDLQDIKNFYDFDLRLYKQTVKNIVHTKSRIAMIQQTLLKL